MQIITTLFGIVALTLLGVGSYDVLFSTGIVETSDYLILSMFTLILAQVAQGIHAANELRKVQQQTAENLREALAESYKRDPNITVQ